MMFKGGRVLLVGLLMMMLTGCATSTMRHVQAVDSSEDSVKILYNQQVEEDVWERGVLECDLVDGDLENCRQLEVEYE